jgi:amicyanin
MSTKETIIALTVVVFGIGLAGAVLVLSPSVKEKQNAKTSTAAHDETNSDGHHSSDNADLGDVVDLTNQAEVSMNIKDFKYEQPNIKIKKGTTVTWTNQDAVQHNVMQEHKNDNDAHDAPTKEEEKPDVLAGRLLSKGESYSFTFNEVSSSPYHCSPHPYMKGSVTVVE